MVHHSRRSPVVPGTSNQQVPSLLLTIYVRASCVLCAFDDSGFTGINSAYQINIRLFVIDLSTPHFPPFVPLAPVPEPSHTQNELRLLQSTCSLHLRSLTRLI